jgi:hypothetical protein
MKELKKSTILLVIFIIGFLFISYSFLEPNNERNNNSLSPKFNNFHLLFWSIIYSLSSVTFIFCILRNRRNKDSDLNQ